MLLTHWFFSLIPTQPPDQILEFLDSDSENFILTQRSRPLPTSQTSIHTINFNSDTESMTGYLQHLATHPWHRPSTSSSMRPVCLALPLPLPTSTGEPLDDTGMAGRLLSTPAIDTNSYGFQTTGQPSCFKAQQEDKYTTFSGSIHLSHIPLG